MQKNTAHNLERLGINLRDSPLFDAKWYRSAYADLGSCTDLVQHFIEVGLAQQRSPNAFIDLAWYATRYQDVRRAAADPFSHYMEFGWHEGRDPSPWFSSSRYLSANPDVREAHLNPLLHFLQWGKAEGRSPLGLLSVDLNAAELCVREEDRWSVMVSQWITELGFHGTPVCVRVIDARAPVQRATRAAQGLFPLMRPGRLPRPFFSVNGAGLTPRLAKAAGLKLIVIFDDLAAARSIRPDLRDALSSATVATTSPEVAKVLAGIPGSAVACYAEPMSGSYLHTGSLERTNEIVWRCRSPRASVGEPIPKILERLAIAQRLMPHGLTVIGDAGWRDQRAMLGNLDVRSDWASQSCARASYGSAKLSIITPPLGREGEVTSDIMIALASGTLPVAPFALGPALFARYGSDCPIALYKDVEEIAAIAAHYLSEEEERAALAEKGRNRLFGEQCYSAAIGEVIRQMAIRGP